jgi:hypothetical protein
MDNDAARSPETPDDLHRWIRDTLDVTIARRPLIEGHDAPFDYLTHAFLPQQAGQHDCPQDCVVWANRGGGKTFLGAVATALDLLFRPGIQVRILAGSLEQAGRMHAHLQSLFARPALAARVAGRITEKRLRLKNGSSVELLAQSQASVRGTRVQKLRCDEVELFDPRIWEAAQLVTRSAQLGDHHVHGTIECLSTMHRPHGLMHTLVEEARAGVRRLIRWGVVDVLGRCDSWRLCEHDEGECPLFPECAGRAKDRDDSGEPPGHIDVDDALRMKSRVSLATWEAEMLCLRPSRTDAVIPEFDLATHVVDELPPLAGAAWIGGMDFGYRAPTVVLWGAVDPHGVVWIVDERVVSEVVLDEHVRAIHAAPHPPMDWIGVDPAGQQRSDQTGVSAITVLARSGLRVKRRRLGVHEGLQLIRARLKPATGTPRLFVARRCRKLVESLERHHYPPDKPESIQPLKDGTDHAVDALRYMIVNLDKAVTTNLSSYLP